jgi:methoxymalonate biosynthesis acyl carrier protein
MKSDEVLDVLVIDAAAVAEKVTAYLEAKANAPVAADLDLAAAGVLTSMVAMEIVVFLESTFGVAIIGSDLKLDNFRSVDAMVALVLRLHENPDA